MAGTITTAFWSMTINNYDETDLVMVQNGYPDHLRELVHTLEEGDEGTPHIQAWLKLQRQQRLSFVKKLFPRGHFKPLTNDEYVVNTKRYAQKLDDTAVSAAVHRFNDPIPDPITELTRVVEDVINNFYEGYDWHNWREKDFLSHCAMVEFQEVELKPKLAKFYVSTLYKNVKKQFWRAIASSVCKKLEDTHTHTHSDEKFSVAEGINNEDGEDDEEREDGSCSSEGEDDEEDCEDNEEGEGSDVEGWDEGGDDESC